MWVVLPLLYAFGAVLTHAAVSRLILPLNTVIRFLIGGTILGCVLALHLVSIYQFTSPTLAGLVAYALLCELYLFIFTLVMSSVSAGLLFVLERGPFREQEIERRYNGAAMVRARVERLCANDFLRTDANGYFLTRKGLRTLHVFALLRDLFRHARAPGQGSLPRNNESSRTSNQSPG
jgi:hypothetical protein